MNKKVLFRNMQQSPLLGVGLDVERNVDSPKKIN
jgi:hypothetical protein